jgi:hypothetical protein
MAIAGAPFQERAHAPAWINAEHPFCEHRVQEILHGNYLNNIHFLP